MINLQTATSIFTYTAAVTFTLAGGGRTKLTVITPLCREAYRKAESLSCRHVTAGESKALVCDMSIYMHSASEDSQKSVLNLQTTFDPVMH